MATSNAHCVSTPFGISNYLFGPKNCSNSRPTAMENYTFLGEGGAIFYVGLWQFAAQLRYSKCIESLQNLTRHRIVKNTDHASEGQSSSGGDSDPRRGRSDTETAVLR